MMGECDLEVIGTPSRLRLIRKAAALARVLTTLDLSREECVGSGIVHWSIAQTELRKLKKRCQFPDERVRIKGAQIHYVTSQTY